MRSRSGWPHGDLTWLLRGHPGFVNEGSLPQGVLGPRYLASSQRFEGSRLVVTEVNRAFQNKFSEVEFFGIVKAAVDVPAQRYLLPVRYAGVDHKGDWWFAHEHPGLPTLRQKIKERSGFTRPEAFTYLEVAASVLSHLHRHKLVHGRLTPDSIFVDDRPEEPHVKIADSYIAHAVLREKYPRTVPPPWNGGFTAPEARSDLGKYGPKSDIYALGKVLTFMFVADAFTTDVPDSPRERWKPLLEAAGPEIEEIVKSCLRRSPYFRPSATKLRKKANELRRGATYLPQELKTVHTASDDSSEWQLHPLRQPGPVHTGPVNEIGTADEEPQAAPDPVESIERPRTSEPLGTTESPRPAESPASSESIETQEFAEPEEQPEEAPLPEEPGPADSPEPPVRKPAARRGGWRFTAGGMVDATVVVSGEAVFVAAMDGSLRALHAYSGELFWSLDLESPLRVAPLLHRGILYQVTEDGDLHAVDPADGDPRWSRNIGAASGGDPAIGSDALYLTGADGRLRTVALTDDHTALEHEHEDAARSVPALSAGLVILGTVAGVLVHEPESGRFQQYETGDSSGCTPLADRGTVYLGTAGRKKNPLLLAFDLSTRSPRWAVSTYGLVTARPAADATRVYAADEGGVTAFRAESGEQEWSFPLDEVVTADLLLEDGVLYVAGRDRMLRALDARTGTQRWAFRAGGSFGRSGPVAANGLVYAGSADGHLYAVDAVDGRGEQATREEIDIRLQL